MAKYDGAKWRPIADNYTANGQNSVRGVVIHIMDGTLNGTDSWFRNRAAKASSHFGTGRDGALYQWVDTRHRAWAQAGGNPDWLSVENEGRGGDALTAHQVERCAEVLAWAHKTHGVPLQRADGPGGKGLGYHAMGGRAWGNHPSCPGARVVDQLDAVVSRAKVLAGGFEPFPGDAWFKASPKSPIVTAMGRRLVAAGCSAYKTGPGDQWTDADRESFRKWQRALGDAPAYCDGWPGKRQWDALKVPRVS